MRIARLLHWPSVAWGLARISSRELVEWEILDRLEEPHGDDRLDALFAWLIANLRSIESARPVSIDDCYPPYLPPRAIEHPLTEAQLQDKVRRLFDKYERGQG